MPDLSECQYNTPLPKVHTHMISYSFPNGKLRKPLNREAIRESAGAIC